MYKPPENTNRVKAMKLKFESQGEKDCINSRNITNSKTINNLTLENFAGKFIENHLINDPVVDSGKESNSATCDLTTSKSLQGECINYPFLSKHLNDETQDVQNHLRSTQLLNRQFSDPASKRNIKRTPAFRLDKNVFIEKEHGFQRNASQNSFKSKIDRLKCERDSSRLKENCDIESLNNNINGKKILCANKSIGEIKIKLYSTSEVNQNINKSTKCPKLDSNMINSSGQSCVLNSIASDLYAQPMKKIQRDKHKELQLSETIYTASTVKLKDISALKLHGKQDLNVVENSQVNGSDTIRNALKRPLPVGPAPKKPPRTFQHASQNENKIENLLPNKSETNITSLNLDTEFTDTLQKYLRTHKTPYNIKSRKDPQYMLDRLETALRKKMLLQKQIKMEYISEDNDNVFADRRRHPRLKRQSNIDNSSSEEDTRTVEVESTMCITSCSDGSQQEQSYSFNISPNASPICNFNCLPSLSCSKSLYSDIKEPDHTFFVDHADNDNEPIYAEPFQYLPTDNDTQENVSFEKRNCTNNNQNRNSLYYMVSKFLSLFDI